MADDVGCPGASREERGTDTPCLDVGPDLVKELERLVLQGLAGTRVKGDLDRLFELQQRTPSAREDREEQVTCAKEVHSDPSICMDIWRGRRVGACGGEGGYFFFFTLGRAALPGRPWYGCLEEVLKGKKKNRLEGIVVWFVRVGGGFVCLLIWLLVKVL